MVDTLCQHWQVSIRRACAVLQPERSSYHYKSHRPDQAGLKQRIKAIAETRVRYGSRRITVLLRREAWLVNAKRVHRLYREMWLQLRNKTPKRKVKAKLREDRRPGRARNDVWAMYFLHDQFYDGRNFRVLSIIDTFTRYSPALDAQRTYTGADVVQILERVCKEVGYPKVIRCDNVLNKDVYASNWRQLSFRHLAAAASHRQSPRDFRL